MKASLGKPFLCPESGQKKAPINGALNCFLVLSLRTKLMDPCSQDCA